MHPLALGERVILPFSRRHEQCEILCIKEDVVYLVDLQVHLDGLKLLSFLISDRSTRGPLPVWVSRDSILRETNPER